MRIHVLAGNDNTYTIVVHGPTPTGTNSAGFTWVALLVATGRNASSLTVGTGPGQTTLDEINAIKAGTTMEGTFSFTDNGGTAAQRNAALDLQATQIIANMGTELKDRLRHYGATRNGV